MNSVVLNISSVQPSFILKILFKLPIHIVYDRFPTGINIKICLNSQCSRWSWRTKGETTLYEKCYLREGAFKNLQLTRLALNSIVLSRALDKNINYFWDKLFLTKKYFWSKTTHFELTFLSLTHADFRAHIN